MKMFAACLLLFFLPLIISDCPDNTYKWPDEPPSKCYSFFSSSTSFDKAEFVCNNVGGHLASVHDGFTNSFLRRQANENFTSSTTADYWIGGKKLANQKTWNWTDGTPFDFTEWQDSGSGDEQACSAVLLSIGRWNAVDCGQLKPYICESDEISTQSTTTKAQISTTTISTTPSMPYCTKPWQYFDNSCYYWANYANWGDAEASCAKNDSHLISIHSLDEINFVKSLHNADFWTGLYSNDTPIYWNSTWHYTDNSAVDYLSWSDPFFPNHNGFQCVRTNGLNFTNINCSKVLTVFCKKVAVNAVITPPPVPTTPKPVGNCLSGWSYNSNTNFCYLSTYPIHANFTTLEGYCQRFKGGHLTSFKDADEFNFVYKLYSSITSVAWIGLYSDDNAVTWQFIDGTPFNYRSWYSGYPIRNGNTCASTYISASTSNAYPCSQSLYGVCKMPPLTI